MEQITEDEANAWMGVCRTGMRDDPGIGGSLGDHDGGRGAGPRSGISGGEAA
jgi:hypothetical protein